MFERAGDEEERQSDLPWAIDRLRAVVADLDAVFQPTEAQFLGVGAALWRASSVLGGIGEDFDRLSRLLTAAEATRSAAALDAAVRQCATVAAGSDTIVAFLRQMDGAVAGAGRPLAGLAKIVGEVGALAINAKIQASHVGRAGVGFSVFTREIGHLRDLADGAVGKASRRIGGLLAAIRAAIAAEEDFERTRAPEADAVRAELEESLAALTRRRGLADESLAAMRERSRAVAARIASCIGEMQIGDLTSQRVAHVRLALEIVRSLIDGSTHDLPALAQGLDTPRKVALAAAVCRLQGRQFDRAIRDFVEEVGKLKANIEALAGEAAAVVVRASAIFGHADGQSFVVDLRHHAGRAASLLATYAEARAGVRGMVATVVDDLRGLETDMETIQSVDADLRIMGLNASLNCARLGPAGRALGVVAQELRACSHRTEEAAGAVSSVVADAAVVSRRLADSIEAGHGDATALHATVADSAGSLAEFGKAVDRSLADILQVWTAIAELLDQTFRGLSLHEEVTAAAGQMSSRLSEIAEGLGSDPELEAAVRDDVSRLLAHHYTMESERLLHDLFDAGQEAGGIPAAAAPAGNDDDSVTFF